MERADSLLAPIIKNIGIEERVKFAEIKKKWEIIFNKPLFYHMSPYTFSNGELLLNVDSPVWLQELKFYKEEILKKLHSYGVRTVRFRLGKVSPKENTVGEKKRQKDLSLNAEELSFIEQTIASLDDEPLKAIVKTSIEKAIKTGKTRIK